MAFNIFNIHNPLSGPVLPEPHPSPLPAPVVLSPNRAYPAQNTAYIDSSNQIIAHINTDRYGALTLTAPLTGPFIPGQSSNHTLEKKIELIKYGEYQTENNQTFTETIKKTVLIQVNVFVFICRNPMNPLDAILTASFINKIIIVNRDTSYRLT